MSGDGSGAPGPKPRRSTGPSVDQMLAMARIVLGHPRLWWTALGALWRLAAPGWWRRAPYLPVPDGRLWEFRMVTAYGSDQAAPDPGDLISYLQWCRSTGPVRRARLWQPRPSGIDHRSGRRDPVRPD